MGKRITSTITRERSAARHAWEFVKTTLIGGAVFLVPTLILIVLLVKAAKLLRHLAQPLSSLLPMDRAFGVLAADIAAIVLAVLVSFVAGLLARASFAHRFVEKAEAGVLWRIPGYGLIKGLTDSLDENPASSSLQPVLVHFDDCAQLAFEVDQLSDGRRVVYVPGAPDTRSGAMFVVDAARVETVAMTYPAAMKSLRTLGRGVGQSLRTDDAEARH
jgi:uncharacterized membrane protein